MTGVRIRRPVARARIAGMIPTTWEYSANPILMDENFRRGFYRNGQRILGMGMPASALLADYYVAAANVCDEALTEGGNSEKRYVCSVIVNDDAEWHIAVDAFRTAYAGDMLEKYGQFGPIAGAAQSIVGTFTDGDLSKDHATSFSLKLPRSDLVNQVYGSFINPDKNWENDAFAPVTDSGWLAEDNGEPRAQDAQLLMVPKRYQANRIAQILARKARQPARHSGVYGPAFAKFEPGDWVTVTNRFGSFTMLITAKERMAPLVHQFSFRQIAASVYGGAGSVVTPPTVVEVSIPPHVTTISGFAVTAVSIAGANGQIRPGIKVDWNPPSDPSAVAVRIEYRIQGGANMQPILHLAPADGTLTIQSDLMAGTLYEVRVRYVLDPDLTTIWSNWLSVTTTSAYIVATSGIATDTQNYFDRFRAEVEGEALSNILEALETYQSDEGIRYTFNASLQQVLATQDASYAAITVTMQVLASADAAFATSLTTVEAKANGASAFGAFKMEAEVTPLGGALASISALVSADSGASFVNAGWRLDVFDSGGGLLKGRMVVLADQFAIVQNAGGTPFTPFAVIGPDTFINRVVVNDEVVSDNYAEDANGSPLAGFRLGDDGRMSSFQGDYFDMQAKGGTFTERPLISAATIFRNGIPVDSGTAYWVESVAGAVRFPFDNDARFYFATFVRSPDKLWISGSGVAKDGSTIMSALRKEYLIPPGKLLPPVITLSASSVSGVIELRDDGTIVYVDYDSNGAPVTQSALAERWMYSLERDPTNLLGASVLVGALGLSRRVFPFRVPLTGCSLLKCDVLGAGGGYDNSTSGIYGGPGGYVYGEIPVGWTELVKPGDELSIIVGEGGQGGQGANALGYGGRGQEQDVRASGGGLSGIWHRDYSLRTNALLIAGGGGAGEGSAKGGPGGGTSAGGNGASGDGSDRMTGLPWARIGTAKKPGGGGGYEGGGYGSLVSSNNYGGMGGTNFIRPGVGIANSVNVGRSVDGNGGSTSALPPTNITGKAIYTTWADCLGTSSLAGRGTQQTQASGSRAGDGRVFIEIVP